MKLVVRLAVLLLALGALPAAALAQEVPEYSFNSGIKLRGMFHLNRSAVSASSETFSQPEAGYGVGLEFVGNHLGLGLYGFTAGQTKAFDSETTPVTLVLEGNYYYPIEKLRLAPYAGVHTGLGTYTKEYFDEPKFPTPADGFKDLGYQVGLRFKPVPVIGLDVQWRRQSTSVFEQQDPTLERTQILAGITLF